MDRKFIRNLGKTAYDKVTGSRLVIVAVQYTSGGRAVRYATRMRKPGDHRDIDDVQWFADNEIGVETDQKINKVKITEVDFQPGDYVNISTEYGPNAQRVRGIIFWCWGDTDIIMGNGSRIQSSDVIGVSEEGDIENRMPL